MSDSMVDSGAASLADFETEAPLYKQFPLQLSNGKTLGGLRVICTSCGDRLSGDRLRGTVVQSLTHVVSVTGSGYCHCCDRLTRFHCRIRANSDATVLEWLATNGQWQAREVLPPTIGERVRGIVGRVATAVRTLG